MSGPHELAFPSEFTALRGQDPGLADRFQELCGIIGRYESALIAFSGGADSALLAYMSSRLLERSLCVIARSPTISDDELSGAKSFADRHGIELVVMDHNELDDERFCVNDRNRCFYCKDGLFKALARTAKARGMEVIFDGSNHDDLGDYRPGRRAGMENGVASPLLEAGMGKEDIRRLSRTLGLETWNKPQMACLASRVPYGRRVTADVLEAIERAEGVVRGLGYRDVRVRHHGDIARIELGKDERLDLEMLGSVVPHIKKLKFKYVVLDLEGYRTGSLNE